MTKAMIETFEKMGEDINALISLSRTDERETGELIKKIQEKLQAIEYLTETYPEESVSA